MSGSLSSYNPVSKTFVDGYKLYAADLNTAKNDTLTAAAAAAASAGATGPAGPAGPQGPAGAAGVAGAPGPSINSGTVSTAGALSLVRSDGTTIAVVGTIVGAAGPAGPQGVAGTGLNNRGTWAAGTYNPGDYVFAPTSGTSGPTSLWVLGGSGAYASSTEPNADLSHWNALTAPAGPAGPAGASGPAINSGTIVSGGTLELIRSDGTTITVAGTLSGSGGASVPASAALLASNAGGTLVPIALDPSALVVNTGTLGAVKQTASIAAAVPNAGSIDILITNSGSAGNVAYITDTQLSSKLPGLINSGTVNTGGTLTIGTTNGGSVVVGGTSLIGPAGPAGPTGPTGATGAAGSAPNRTVAGATDTILSGDAYGSVQYTSASAITITCPDLGAGKSVVLLQLGAGQLTATASSGVTLVSDKPTPSFKSHGQYVSLVLTGTGTGTAILSGYTA